MNFDFKRCLFIVVAGFLFAMPVVGCGDSKPSSVTKDADAEAIAEYERLVAEGEAEADDDGSE